MDIERIKTRIAQLLRVAQDDAATAGEIENAIRAARNLMMAHHLEEADLERSDDGHKPEMGQATSRTKFGKVATWEKDLADFVTDLIGGVCWYYSTNHHATPVFIRGRLRQFGAVVFYGVDEEARLAAEVYEELATTIFTMAMAKYGGAYRGNGGLYAEGFVLGLESQLQSIQREANSSNTELVLRSTTIVTAKKVRAREWLRQVCGIRLATGSATYGCRGSESALHEGTADGRSCDIRDLGGKRGKFGDEPKRLTHAQ